MRYAQKLGCTFGLFACSLACFSQQKDPSVIASAGDVSKGRSIVLEWTVGEPAIETLSNASSLITQGFHQPLLQVQKLAFEKAASLQYKIRVYPNPATSVINVQLEQPSEVEFALSLLDETGRQVLNKRLPVNTSSLNLNVSRLSSGTYILRITDFKGASHSDYKIIKSSN